MLEVFFRETSFWQKLVSNSTYQITYGMLVCLNLLYTIISIEMNGMNEKSTSDEYGCCRTIGRKLSRAKVNLTEQVHIEWEPFLGC